MKDLFFASGGFVKSLNATTGDVVWSAKVFDVPASSGTRTDIHVDYHSNLFAGRTGELAMLNINTGEILWKKKFHELDGHGFAFNTTPM